MGAAGCEAVVQGAGGGKALARLLASVAMRRGGAGLQAFSEEKSLFERRAEYLAAQRSLEQNRLSVKSAEYQRLPSLALTGNLGRAAPRFDDFSQ